MSRIFTYHGDQPEIIPPQQVKDILEIMKTQLDILKMLSATTYLVPAGTNISEVPRRGKPMPYPDDTEEEHGTP